MPTNRVIIAKCCQRPIQGAAAGSVLGRSFLIFQRNRTGESWWFDRQNRAVEFPENAFRGVTHKESVDSGACDGAHDDEVDLQFAGQLWNNVLGGALDDMNLEKDLRDKLETAFQATADHMRNRAEHEPDEKLKIFPGPAS